MRRTLVGFGAALLLTASACAQAKHGMTVDDLAKMMRVGAPQVSPDGTWVAYTVSHVDVGEDKSISELWMVSWDGREDIQLTQGKDSVGNPRWSPDGKWLAFTSGRDAGPGGAKGSQVWVLDRRGGEARQLTNVKENLGEYRWSPDSKTLLMTLTVKDQPDEPAAGGKPKPPQPIVLDKFHFKQDVQGFLSDREPHLYMFDVATKKLTKLTNGTASGQGSYGERGGEWSPDGSMVAFTSNQSAPDPDRVANDDVFVVDTKGGPDAKGSAPRKLTTFLGPDQGPLAWTADGKNIIYRQGVTAGYSIYQLTELAMVPVAGGTPRLLAPTFDHWTGAPVLAGGGKSVLTEVQEDRNTFVGEIAIEGGKGGVVHVVKDQGSASGLSVGGGHTALLWTTDAAPSEIYALEQGKLRKLTGHNDAEAASLTIQPIEELSAKTSDNSEVHSLLTMPVGYVAGTKAPMLLFIHGGPTGQDAHGFNESRQMFAAHGYAVLNVNYRGSTGRGHAYSEAISADWGDKEVKDLTAAVDGAIATGKIDPEKLMVGGWSYGGILTDYMIASTTRFKAASSGAGMGSLLVLYGIDQYILQYENEIGPPWKNPELYVKLSYPFFHADRIKTPTLFMGGDKDFNVPIEGGEQMYQALKSVGTPAELIVYPGEFHGFTRPSFIKDRWQRWFAWYDRYGLGKAESAPVNKAE